MIDSSRRPGWMAQRVAVAIAVAAGAVAATRRGEGREREATGTPPPAGPSFPIGGPTSAAWREEALTKAQELSALATWLQASRDDGKPAGRMFESVWGLLGTAKATAAGEDRRERRGKQKPLRRLMRLRSSLGGAAFERTLGNLDAAETHLLRLAPDDYLWGQLPSLRAHINRYLPKDDPRRECVTALATDQPDELRASDRDAILSAYHAANSQRRRDLIRLRSFRNLLIGGALTLFALAIVVAIIGVLHKEWLPLCFLPEDEKQFVCPRAETPVPNPQMADVDPLVARTTRWEDLLLVELIGMVAATLAGAVALRRMRGTSTPYGVPVALILLKLPTGALTAVIGLLFMRGGFVPGLTALDDSAQILAWAILFGYSQQLLTRLVDQQAHSLLHDVGGQGPAGDRRPKSR